MSMTMKSEILRYSLTALAVLLPTYSIFLLASSEKVVYLTQEDGIYEAAGAIFLLLASVFFFITYYRNRKGNDFWLFKTRKNLFFLLLGLLFLFGFGEEISWGQRIFGLETPEGLKDANIQEELNLHNLEIFQMYTKDGEMKTGWTKYLAGNKLLSLFWATFCCLVPLLAYAFGQFRRFFERLNLPIVPLFIGGLFVFNYLLTKIVGLTFGPEEALLRGPLVETKESAISFLFFGLSYWFFRHPQQATAADAPEKVTSEAATIGA